MNADWSYRMNGSKVKDMTEYEICMNTYKALKGERLVCFCFLNWMKQLN